MKKSIDGIYTDSYSITYKYIPSDKESDVLVVVFSALSASPMYNMIGFMNSYDVNKLFILDDCGGKSGYGCYYMCEKMDFTISDCIGRLIEQIKEQHRIQRVVTAGTSKGGTAALYYAAKFGYHSCIVHEPQIKILNFLIDNNLSSLRDVMTGNREDSEYLNEIMYQVFKKAVIQPHVYISTGKQNYTYSNHLKDFITFLDEHEWNVKVYYSEINNHSVIQDYYKNFDRVICEIQPGAGKAILPRIEYAEVDKNRITVRVSSNQMCKYNYLLTFMGVIVQKLENVQKTECSFMVDEVGKYSMMIEAYSGEKKTKLMYEPFIVESLGISDERKPTMERIYSEEEYLYIRGYLIKHNDGIRPEVINKNWKEMLFGKQNNYVIYYDAKNQVSECVFGENKTWVFLMGTFMDTESSEDNIYKIASELCRRLDASMDAFWDYVDILNGRHIIVYSKDGEENLITDATGMRATYYCEKRFLISSHYNLINDIVTCEKHPFFDEYFSYYKTNIACVAMPGNLTPYEGIKLLIPNHALNLKDGYTIWRFFPRKKLTPTDIDEVCDYIASNIKRQYERLADTHDIIHSMTAGCDSRICLAAAKNVKDKITLFTYHNEQYNARDVENVDRENNYRVAKWIADSENIKHLEVLFRGPYPKTMVDIMNRNHYHPHNKLIEEMRAKYEFTPNTIHVRSSVVESCRNTTHILVPTSNKSLSYQFATWTQYAESKIREKATGYFETFAEECEFGVYEKLGLSVDQAYYWEVRLSAWLNASVLTDNDMLCDTYMLFNVRKIMALGMTLPTYWRNRNILYKEIIQRLWPSLLNYNMPNQVRNTYDLVDQEFTGCLKFRNCVLKSGNLNMEKCVPTYLERREYGACFGFASTSVGKGDYISLEFENSVTKDNSFVYEFNIFTAWQDTIPYGEIRYQLIINDKVVYNAYCSEFNNRVNQIIYCFKADAARIDKIVIRLLADKDTMSCNYNGIINVKSVTLKREWIKTFNYTPVIISSKDVYREIGQ